MIRHVPVDELPPKLAFPGELERKIYYDPQRKQLCFNGFMSKATFDRLYRLTDDRHYRRALEELFQICTFDDSDGRTGSLSRRCACLAVGLTSLLAAAALVALLFWR